MCANELSGDIYATDYTIGSYQRSKGCINTIRGINADIHARLTLSGAERLTYMENTLSGQKDLVIW